MMLIKLIKKESYPIEKKESMKVLIIFETKYFTRYGIILKSHEKLIHVFFPND